MLKNRISIIILMAGIMMSSQTLSAKSLTVSDNGRYLAREDGTPFFYLGDTAWELFHRLNREEADLYLENRAEKDFSVIQAVVIAERNGLEEPNPYGHFPIIDKDPARLVEAYFEHVDYIVNKANELGLFIGMLPTWGCHWSSLRPENVIFTPESAYQFGKLLGRRYKESQIIWILGGDRNIRNKMDYQIIERMAEGLREGDGGTHLITYHPMGPGLSSDYFHEEKWLDFNMVQSSHGAHDHDNGLYAEHDLALTPRKPTLDGEPRYETIPVGFYFDGFNRQDKFDDYDCRQAAYWSVLAGACGHTYGNNNIWQMWSEKHDPILDARTPWHEALDHPGAFQMNHLKNLFEAYPFEQLIPNQNFIVDGPRTGGAKIRAAVSADASFALVYSPRGEKFTVDRSLLPAINQTESWFDPRYGVTYKVHTPVTHGIQTYTPPTSGRGCDWILILEDAGRQQ